MDRPTRGRKRHYPADTTNSASDQSEEKVDKTKPKKRRQTESTRSTHDYFFRKRHKSPETTPPEKDTTTRSWALKRFDDFEKMINKTYSENNLLQLPTLDVGSCSRDPVDNLALKEQKPGTERRTTPKKRTRQSLDEISLDPVNLTETGKMAVTNPEEAPGGHEVKLDKSSPNSKDSQPFLQVSKSTHLDEKIRDSVVDAAASGEMAVKKSPNVLDRNKSKLDKNLSSSKGFQHKLELVKKVRLDQKPPDSVMNLLEMDKIAVTNLPKVLDGNKSKFDRDSIISKDSYPVLEVRKQARLDEMTDMHKMAATTSAKLLDRNESKFNKHSTHSKDSRPALEVRKEAHLDEMTDTYKMSEITLAKQLDENESKFDKDSTHSKDSRPALEVRKEAHLDKMTGTHKMAAITSAKLLGRIESKYKKHSIHSMNTHPALKVRKEARLDEMTGMQKMAATTSAKLLGRNEPKFNKHSTDTKDCRLALEVRKEARLDEMTDTYKRAATTSTHSKDSHLALEVRQEVCLDEMTDTHKMRATTSAKHLGTSESKFDKDSTNSKDSYPALEVRKEVCLVKMTDTHKMRAATSAKHLDGSESKFDKHSTHSKDSHPALQVRKEARLDEMTDTYKMAATISAQQLDGNESMFDKDSTHSKDILPSFEVRKEAPLDEMIHIHKMTATTSAMLLDGNESMSEDKSANSNNSLCSLKVDKGTCLNEEPLDSVMDLTETDKMLVTNSPKTLDEDESKLDKNLTDLQDFQLSLEGNEAGVDKKLPDSVTDLMETNKMALPSSTKEPDRDELKLDANLNNPKNFQSNLENKEIHVGKKLPEFVMDLTETDEVGITNSTKMLDGNDSKLSKDNINTKYLQPIFELSKETCLSDKPLDSILDLTKTDNISMTSSTKMQDRYQSNLDENTTKIREFQASLEVSKETCSYEKSLDSALDLTKTTKMDVTDSTMILDGCARNPNENSTKPKDSHPGLEAIGGENCLSDSAVKDSTKPST